MTLSAREHALKGLQDVVQQGRSTSDIIPQFYQLSAQDRGMATDLLMGSLHHYFELSAIANTFLKQPFKRKDQDIFLILILGLYQLLYTRGADHAVIHETVNLCHHHGKDWATGIINAILRKAQRMIKEGKPPHAEKPADQLNLPNWLYQQLSDDWPDADLKAMHQRAPMTLRVNANKISRDDYLSLLADNAIDARPHESLPQAIILTHSHEVTGLPGYTEGLFSIQDAAAQWAALLLDVHPGQAILDACAAPGGKSAHILEQTANDCHLVAVDNVQSRLDRMQENLQRLGLSADIRCGDAINTDQWLQADEQFDRILCDAPCSATGIIRRHPDISLHRTAKDIRKLNQIQWRLLKSLWQTLKPGGEMLYSTCSLLKSENETMVGDFLRQHPDARLLPLSYQNNILSESGMWQIFPGQEQMDGFFYARLHKTEN